MKTVKLMLLGLCVILLGMATAIDTFFENFIAMLIVLVGSILVFAGFISKE